MNTALVIRPISSDPAFYGVMGEATFSSVESAVTVVENWTRDGFLWEVDPGDYVLPMRGTTELRAGVGFCTDSREVMEHLDEAGARYIPVVTADFAPGV